VYCSGAIESFPKAREAFCNLFDVPISVAHLRTLSNEVGQELQQQRDKKTDDYLSKPIPAHRSTQPSTQIPLAVVSVDGGRIQTRNENGPRGVHNPHWRETKNAVFLRMSSVSLSGDPCPELPSCFVSRDFMSALLDDVGKETTDGADTEPSVKSDFTSWRPEVRYRTCLSSMSDSKRFGQMMEAEADSRGFYMAEKKAFVSDGLGYNWMIHQRHFSCFTPILDFIHAVEHIYRAAKAIYECPDERWKAYTGWANQTWQGHVAEVIASLRVHQASLGVVQDDMEETHPCVVLAAEIRYLENNSSRMNYPAYRAEGLPITSAHMESYVKEVGKRVKASDKFWNDGASAEFILCLKAAMLSDGDRLRQQMRNRPGWPFHPNTRRDRDLSLVG